MKNSTRFDSAINKLYDAFHSNTLNPEDCKQCAVGNILDNKDQWRHLTDQHGYIKLNYVGLIHQNLGRRFSGYSPIELLKIENAFLKGCGYNIAKNSRLYKPKKLSKSNYFDGLCEVVAKLCELDNIRDVMDCNILFDVEKHDNKLQMV